MLRTIHQADGRDQLPPDSQVGSRSPSPLRTERASFPALRSSMTNAPRGTRRCSCAIRCIVNLTVTVGMEGYQIRPLVILVIVIPVMQFEVLPALDHLSVDGTQSCLLVQVLRTKYRGCPQGALSIIVLEVRLPAFFSGVSQRSPSTREFSSRCSRSPA